MYLVQNRNEVMRAIRPCIHRIPILYVLRLRASFYSMQTAIFFLLLFLFCLFFAMIHSCKFMNGIWWWKQSWRSRAATTTRITHGKSRYIQHVCLKDETLCEQCAKTLNICMGECLCLTLANQQQCSSRKKSFNLIVWSALFLMLWKLWMHPQGSCPYVHCPVVALHSQWQWKKKCYSTLPHPHRMASTFNSKSVHI